MTLSVAAGIRLRAQEVGDGGDNFARIVFSSLLHTVAQLCSQIQHQLCEVCLKSHTQMCTWKLQEGKCKYIAHYHAFYQKRV